MSREKKTEKVATTLTAQEIEAAKNPFSTVAKAMMTLLGIVAGSVAQVVASIDSVIEACKHARGEAMMKQALATRLKMEIGALPKPTSQESLFIQLGQIPQSFGDFGILALSAAELGLRGVCGLFRFAGSKPDGSADLDQVVRNGVFQTQHGLTASVIDFVYHPAGEAKRLRKHLQDCELSVQRLKLTDCQEFLSDAASELRRLESVPATRSEKASAATLEAAYADRSGLLAGWKACRSALAGVDAKVNAALTTAVPVVVPVTAEVPDPLAVPAAAPAK